MFSLNCSAKKQVSSVVCWTQTQFPLSFYRKSELEPAGLNVNQLLRWFLFCKRFLKLKWHHKIPKLCFYSSPRGKQPAKPFRRGRSVYKPNSPHFKLSNCYCKAVNLSEGPFLSWLVNCFTGGIFEGLKMTAGLASATQNADCWARTHPKLSWSTRSTRAMLLICVKTGECGEQSSSLWCCLKQGCSRCIRCGYTNLDLRLKITVPVREGRDDSFPSWSLPSSARVQVVLFQTYCCFFMTRFDKTQKDRRRYRLLASDTWQRCNLSCKPLPWTQPSVKSLVTLGMKMSSCLQV